MTGLLPDAELDARPTDKTTSDYLTRVRASIWKHHESILSENRVNRKRLASESEAQQDRPIKIANPSEIVKSLVGRVSGRKKRSKR